MAADDLSRLIDLEVRLYQLITRSHLRIGAGEGTADVATDNPIIRALIMEGDSDKRVPYLPASSLHGVIRAWVEKALRSSQEPLTGETLKAKVNEIQDENARRELLDRVKKEFKDILGHELVEEELYQHWQVYLKPYVSNPLSDVDKCERVVQQDETQRWKVIWLETLGIKTPCVVSRIFGYMGQRGRVKFTHAWPTTETLPLDVITRVAINRLTGAADEGKLFDLEAIPPGVSFHFFTVMENMNDTDKTHFEMGLKALNLQLAGLGAHSTIGFGAVDIGSIFKVKIAPAVFKEDVENRFIKKMVPDEKAKIRNFDWHKFPKFFQALMAAHLIYEKDKTQPLNGLIQFI